MDGKVSTVTKTVYVSSNGRAVTVFRRPDFYYALTNPKGELKLYFPSSNEVFSRTDPALASGEELLMLFLLGRASDLGLSNFGYKGSASLREEGYIKRTFTSPEATRPTVEIVYDNYLPIYCCYTDPSGRVLSKKYFSHYIRESRFVFPGRVDDITYNAHKKDSTVVRTLYSNLQIDSSAPEFDFEIPAGAKPVQIDPTTLK